MNLRTAFHCVVVAGLLSAALNVRGASGTWNVDAAGNWSATGNWTPAVVPGTAAGDTVGLTYDVTAARTVTMDTTSRTLGTLNIGDSGSSFFGYTLTNSGGATLTFNNSGVRANLVQATTTTSDVIALPITLTDNLSVSNNSTLTLSGVISGGKSIAKTGTGTLVLSGVNTFTGGMTNLQGTVSVNTIGNASVAQPLGAVASVTLGSSGQNATLQYSGATATTTMPFILATGGTGTFQIDNANTVLSRTAPIIGAGGLIKSGPGVLTFGFSADTYSGNTIVNDGILRLDGNANGNTTFYLNGGILLNNGSFFIQPITVTADGSGLDAIGKNYQGPLTSSGGNYTLKINTSIYATTVSLLGAVSAGPGLTLLLDVQKGVLLLGNSTAFTNNTVSLQLQSTATLDMNKLNATFGALSGSGTVSVSTGGGGATSVLTLAGTNSATFSGVIANGTKTVALVRTNTGTQTFSGANTYTGGSTIKDGTILIGVDNVSTTSGALGPATAAVTLGDTTGSANASLLTAGAFTFANAVTVAAGSSGTATLGGSTADESSFTGNITLNKAATLTSSSDGNVTFSGIISGTGFGITKTDPGIVTLSGVNTYTGGTTISAGSLQLGANNALASTGALTLNGGTFSNRDFTNALGALTIQSSSGIDLGTNGTAATLTFASGSYTAGTLTVNNWTGTGGQSGTANKIFITAAPSATFLTNITFTGFFAGAVRLGTGEIVPVTALPPTKLVITSVNGQASPTIGTPFSVVVQAQDDGGTPKTVTADTAVTLSLNTGSGTLGGTLTGTITAGTNSVTISGVTYSKAESGVVITATRTSGDTLTDANSSAFTVNDVTPWYNAAWTNRIAVTIDYTKVSGNQTNFPVLINLTNASLQASALASGDDILFTSADGTTKLDHEIESYTNSNGALVAWVKVPILSSTVDTTLYLYYGNSSATNQQNVTAVWDANFKGVWHLKEDSAGSGNLSLYRDSTTNNNNADDLVASTNKSGKIAGGQGFNGSSDTIKAANSASLTITQRITLSVWVNYTAFVADSAYANIVGKGYDGNNEGYYIRTQRSPSGSPNALVVGSFTGSPSYTDHSTSWTISGWNTNEWHHIVGLYDGSNWKLYFDGVEKSTSSSGTGAKANARPVTIGAWDNNGTISRYSNTRIDEIRISADSRSAGWIATEYYNQNSPAAFYSVGSTESAGPTKLAITSINSGSAPTVGAVFNVVVQAQDAGGTPRNAVSDTAVTLSVNTGSGALGGTLIGTITAGTNSVTISGVTYSKAENGVILTATRTSGDSLTAANSSSFSVSPAAVTVSSGLTADNKVYDGTTTAAISSNTVVLSGVLTAYTGNVSLSTNSYTATFSSATVGNGKTVTVSGLTLTGSAAGNYTLTQPSLSANVTAASTLNAVTSSLNPALPGANVTFTATLSVVSPGAGTPTGNITFKDGTTALGTAALNGSGVAVFSTSSLSHGTHTITAEYAGDANFLGSTNTLSPNQTINTAPTATGDTWQRYPTMGAKGRVTMLLANDTDADGDSLTLSSVDSTSAEGGTVSVSDNWLIYEPPTGFTNADSFSYVITDGSLTATGSVSVTVQVDLAQSQNITALEVLGNNSARIHFAGIFGRIYTIQYSESLQAPDWQTLGTRTADVAGKFEFTDNPPQGAPARFYRSTYP